MSDSLKGAAARREAFDRLANEVGYDKADFLWQQVVLNLIEEAEQRGGEKALREFADNPWLDRATRRALTTKAAEYLATTSEVLRATADAVPPPAAVEVWTCDPPTLGVGYQVIRDERLVDGTRIIHEVRLR